MYKKLPITLFYISAMMVIVSRVVWLYYQVDIFSYMVNNYDELFHVKTIKQDIKEAEKAQTL